MNSGEKVRVFHFRGGGGVLGKLRDVNSGEKVRVFHLGDGCSG